MTLRHGEWTPFAPQHIRAPGRAPFRVVNLRNGGERLACYECFICRAEFWERERIPEASPLASRQLENSHRSTPSHETRTGEAEQ